MTTVFDTGPYGKFIEIRNTSGEGHFIERIKTPIFLDSVAFRCILVQFEWYERPKNMPKKVLVTPFSIYISGRK